MWCLLKNHLMELFELKSMQSWVLLVPMLCQLSSQVYLSFPTSFLCIIIDTANRRSLPIKFHGADHVISSELFPEVYSGDLLLWNLSGTTILFYHTFANSFFRLAMVIEIPPSLFKRWKYEWKLTSKRHFYILFFIQCYCMPSWNCQQCMQI